MRKSIHAVVAIVSAVTAGSVAAKADVYTSASFTFGTNPGDANVQSPFTSVLSQGEMFAGNLVFDNNLVPGAGTGFVNVFFSSFPAIAGIPSATALNLPLGGLPAFTLATAQVASGFQNAAIQYNNGNFVGLFYISDFNFQGNPYELQIQGGSFDIVPVVNGNPTFSPLVTGYINSGLGNQQPFTPVAPAVPEPATWAMLLLGFLGLSFLGFRNRLAAVKVAG